MIWDRLGVLTDEVSDNFIEALDWVVEQGLKHVEIRTVNGLNMIHLTDEQVEEVIQEVKKRGLFVSAVASPLFKCALDPSRPVASGDRFGQKEESVESHFIMLDRAITIAKTFDTKMIRIFSFWRENEPDLHEKEIVKHLKTASTIALENEIILLLENEPSCNGGFADEVARIVRSVNSPALAVLWDPGNEVYGGRTSYHQGYEQVRKLIGHVHLKDAHIDEYGNPACVPIGLGAVNFTKQLQALEKDGYQGLFTLETHYIPDGGRAADGTLMSLKGLRKLIKERSVR
jgi:L-ribulose-5-phosphate 3-epimerase